MRLIESVVLKNFKTFASQQVPLSRLTLLSGLNGSGKSTILQALAMLRQSYDANFLVRGAWLLNGELVELGVGRDVLFENAGDTTAAEDIISISLVALPELGDKKLTEVSVVRHEADGDVLWDLSPKAPRAWNEINLFCKGFQYLKADRITPRVIYPKSQHAVSDRNFLGSSGEFTAHYLEEYGDEEIACQELVIDRGQYTGRLLSQVNAWMQEFSPLVRLEVRSIPMTDFVRLEFSYRGQSAAYGNPLRATNVGFGLTHALPVLVACLASQPNRLLLIENPEAQLHPQGQVAMGTLVARAAHAGVQIVVETHSDHILNGIRLAIKRRELEPSEAQFHFFSRSKDGRVEMRSPHVDEHGLLSEWPAGFFTQWDESLLELLS